MLTRLRVKGFKSLLDAEVKFGPFTCIAGTNGAGKSNLFDAILFLRDLADHSIVEAAHKVRDRSGSKHGDLRSIFTRNRDEIIPTITLEADFIVPKSVVDDFGRPASPKTTFLTYKIQLRYIELPDNSEKIELISEDLTYLPKSTAAKRMGYKVGREFAATAFEGVSRSPFIATEIKENESIINISQDGNSGRPSQIPAKFSPRTVLGSANTDERPTILAARREMQSWMLLQLEPSKLRAPDEFSDDAHITFEGAHVPSTLERIKSFEEVSNRVATLLPEVHSISVDTDNTRRLKTLMLRQRNGTEHKARSLSDGTLRFIALATLAFDDQAKGLICLEEPENGIHPSRIPAILELLKEMAVDTESPIDPSNPLRQIIINTHSPIVVKNLTPDELLVAVSIRKGGGNYTQFGAITNSWRLADPERDSERTPKVTPAELLDYLHESETTELEAESKNKLWRIASEQKVFDF